MNFVKTGTHLGVPYHIAILDMNPGDMLNPGNWYGITIGNTPALDPNGNLNNGQGVFSNKDLLESLDYFEDEAKRLIEASLNLTAELNTPFRKELIKRGFEPIPVP